MLIYDCSFSGTRLRNNAVRVLTWIIEIEGRYRASGRAELIIRELKDGYALGKIPTKDFEANEAFFQIVLLAYNLLNWFSASAGCGRRSK